eukprot:1148609-Pelagomonas_calceolata.AAC.2
MLHPPALAMLCWEGVDTRSIVMSNTASLEVGPADAGGNAGLGSASDGGEEGCGRCEEGGDTVLHGGLAVAAAAPAFGAAALVVVLLLWWPSLCLLLPDLPELLCLTNSLPKSDAL